MNQKNVIDNESNSIDEVALVHIVKIGIIKQLHVENLLNDKQYAELLSKIREEKFDNPPCFQ